MVGEILFFCGLMVLGIGGCVGLIFWFRAGSKKQQKDVKKVDADEQIKAEVERAEKLNLKKCRNCGADVPQSDKICMSCNQEP